MAATSISTSNPIAQKIYKAGLIHQAEVASLFMSLVGDEDDAAVCLIDDFSRQRGDTVQVRFSPTRDTTPFLENDEIEGNEESLDFDKMEFKIGYAAFAQAMANQMSQQRVNVNIKKASLTKLAIKWERYWNKNGFNQLCAYTPVNSTAGYALSGFNAVVSIDSDHIIRAGNQATDQAITSADVLDLDLIDELMTRVQSTAYLDYPIAPTSSGYYYLIVHPDQARQLRQNTGDTGWRDLERAKLEGGMGFEGSALEKGFLGIYNNVVLVASDYITKGVQSADSTTAVANTRRAVLLGSKAAYMGFGETYTGGDHLDWREQIRDYKRWGVMADSVFGIKRTEFQDLSGSLQTYGLMILTTYSKV